LQPGADQYSRNRGDPDQHTIEHVQIAVGALNGRAEGGDERDRRQRGARRLVLSIAEPQHQQRHDDGAASDPEQSAEQSRGAADEHQLPRSVSDHGRGGIGRGA
jgi:hypothetical protein